ncbi:nuclear receptor coactivator 5-like isoform X2 [Varroa jacobsoni]|uniref:nuclear receptor coactivator 5-like isoform X2 n=1 Tax=Varroa jacobsoni TaxID=62625 RepID=UPI000BF25931|nr:nuclear receptor coactivator 5-like isoform X2 [Varroa jacobsoni]
MESKWNDALSNNTSDPNRAAQRVFVGNLKPHIVRVDLFDIFSKYGEVTAISINRQGYGFVQYSDEDAAQQALSENGAQVKSCTLQVKPCSVNDLRKKRRDRSRSRSPLPTTPQRYGNENSLDRRRSSSRSPPPVKRSPSPPRGRGGPPPRGPRYDGGFQRDGGNGNYRAEGGSSSYRGEGVNNSNSGGYRSDGHRSGRSPPRRSSSQSQYVPSHHHRGPPLDAPRKPNDCEIVVMSKQQRDYAENVERRLKNLGLKVDVLFLKDEALLAQALDDLGLRGTLYACVIGEQHEVHNSVTLNVLYGVPQEHRNMPVDEALKFLSQNFREHLERQRDRDAADDEREVKFLLKLLIESRYISIREYDLLIQHLTNKRDQLIEEEMGEGRRAPSPHRDPPPSHAMGGARGGSSSQHRPAHDSPNPMKQAMTIEQQNQQLHEKIRNLIGTPPSGLAPAAAPVLGAGVGIGSPATAPLQAPPAPFGLPGGLSGAGGMGQQQPPAPFVNLNNPSVQEALDKLIKQGALGTQLAMGIPEDPRGRRDDMGGPAGGDKEPFPLSRGGQGGYGQGGGGPFDGYGNGGNGAYGGGYGGGAYGPGRDRSPPRGLYGSGDGGRY